MDGYMCSVERPGMPEGGATETLWPCGTLGRPHGLRGELTLRPGPEGLTYLALGARFWVASADGSAPDPVVVERAGGTDRRPYLRLDGVATRDAAARLTGSLLLASGGGLEDIPQYTVGRLLGLPATSGGSALGRVADVLEGVTHEILVIRDDDGEELLVPLVEELVTVDEKRRCVIVREGLVE